ncbi:MAG: hypothetical protein Q9M21_09065, partial [Mariprofundaceae bacterium]|nr:hypothetical protein [Mariprofundaceae bacterium]
QVSQKSSPHPLALGIPQGFQHQSVSLFCLINMNGFGVCLPVKEANRQPEKVCEHRICAE